MPLGRNVSALLLANLGGGLHASTPTFRPNGWPDFRLHDWGHCVSGTGLLTLKRLSGWKTLRIVERYADVLVDHMAEAIA